MVTSSQELIPQQANLWYDAKEDGVLDDSDKTDIGDALPDFTYGLSISLGWKGIDLLIHANGSQGNQVFNFYRQNTYAKGNAPIQFYTDRWTPTNTNTTIAKAGSLADNNYLHSSAMVYDGSYFKIDQIQLGYSLPAKWMKAIHFDSIRLYAALENFFTFSKYNGYDPSSLGTNSTTKLGLDQGSYALSKKVMFGVNLSF